MVRFDWGESGVRHLAPQSTVVIIVDVLSFSSAVDVAASRHGAIFPYPDQDASAEVFAASVGAVLAGPRGAVASLSPHALRQLPLGARLVLPSRNGAVCVLEAMKSRALVLAGSLRNAQAVAQFVQSLGPGTTVTVIAAGERWPDGSLRPAWEDMVGAGAILSKFPEEWLSPEARAARGAYQGAQSNLLGFLRECASGRELIAKGFENDVAAAGEADVSSTVPLLREGAFERG